MLVPVGRAGLAREDVDGRRNGVVACDVYDIGTSGISLTGGDRRSLAPAGLFAVNNDIHHYSRRKRTNCPAITLNGVGNRMAHNRIHDAPHTGVFYSGNDHVLEFNEAYRLAWETGATTQPTRHPVIECDLLNPSMTIVRSRLRATQT